MNTLKASVVAAAVVLSIAIVPQISQAHEHDLRRGTFEGNWSGLPARFEIEKKIGNTWKFEGKILIHATGQYDRITIEQFADNHLVIRRFLSGQHAGKHQTQVTERPETLLRNGIYQVNFRVNHGSGIGTNNLGHLLMPRN